jgi:hypothetical protein
MVANYFVKDKDGVDFECSSRTLASARLVDLQGMIRVMGRDRFLQLVQDLDLDIAKFRDNSARYTVRTLRLASSHVMGSLSQFHTVQELPAVKEDARFRSALTLDFQLRDLSGFSLLTCMFGPDAPLWGCRSTARGRRDMATAVENLENFMGCFYGTAFSGVLKPICQYLVQGVDTTGPTIPENCGATVQKLLIYHDVYLWVEVQRMLHYWSQDVCRLVRSMHYPDIELNCPGGCACLLKSYVRSFVRAALNVDMDGDAPLGLMEAEPHNIFYSETGEFQQVTFPTGSEGDKAQAALRRSSAATTRDPPPGKQKPRPTSAPKTAGSSDHSTEQRSGGDRRGPQGDSSQQNKATEGSVVCSWVLAGLLGVKNSKGVLFGCHGKGCQAGHPKSITEVTQKEAFRSLNRWEVKNSLKEQVLLVASQPKWWKET